jgi:hypothetical protein
VSLGVDMTSEVKRRLRFFPHLLSPVSLLSTSSEEVEPVRDDG